MITFDFMEVPHGCIIVPDHVQLIDFYNESILALNKKLKFLIHFQFFFLCQNTFGLKIAHDPAPIDFSVFYEFFLSK